MAEHRRVANWHRGLRHHRGIAGRSAHLHRPWRANLGGSVPFPFPAVLRGRLIFVASPTGLARRLARTPRPRFLLSKTGPGTLAGHFAYPCDLNHAILRSPLSQSSASAFVANPLMYRISAPGQRASICQSPSAMRLMEKVTRGDFLILPICDVYRPIPRLKICHNQTTPRGGCLCHARLPSPRSPSVPRPRRRIGSICQCRQIPHKCR